MFPLATQEHSCAKSGSIVSESTVRVNSEGNFKMLVRLREGENTLCLECRAAKRMVTVEHRRARSRNRVQLLYLLCSDSDGTFQVGTRVICAVVNPLKGMLLNSDDAV